MAFINIRFFARCVMVLASLALGAAQAQTPPPGEYLREQGSGELKVNGNRKFSIIATGPNGHRCELSGTISGNTARIVEPEEVGHECVVDFKMVGTDIQVENNGSPDCQNFCGMRAGFTGLYIKPALACTRKVGAQTRKSFKSQFDRKDYAAALRTLEPYASLCRRTLDWIELQWIANDLALTHFKLGDKAACQRILKPIALDNSDNTDTEEQRLYNLPPIEAEAYRPILKAIRTNLKLCS